MVQRKVVKESSGRSKCLCNEKQRHWISSGVGAFLKNAVVRDTLHFNHMFFVNARSVG